MKKKISLITILVCILSASIVNAAGKVSMPHALSTALKHSPGEVMEAKISGQTYEVSIKKDDGKIEKVHVDFNGSIVNEAKHLTMVDATELALKEIPGEVTNIRRDGSGYFLEIRKSDGGTAKVRVTEEGTLLKEEVKEQDKRPGDYMTMESAARIALDKEPGELFKTQFVRGLYEIDIKKPNGNLKKVFVDGSGNVIADRGEISEEDAVSIARQQLSGEVVETVKKKKYYVVQIRPGDGYRHFFYVDLENGDIVKTSKSKIYKYNEDFDTWSE